MLSRTPGHVPASISGTRIFHAPAAPGGLPVRAWAQAVRGRSTAIPLRAYLTAHAGAGQRAVGSGPEWQASGDGDGMCTSMVKTAPTQQRLTPACSDSVVFAQPIAGRVPGPNLLIERHLLSPSTRPRTQMQPTTPPGPRPSPSKPARAALLPSSDPSVPGPLPSPFFFLFLTYWLS